MDKQLLLLLQFTHRIIDSDYVYLDVPGHFNVGDNFIAMGALTLLKDIPYQCDYFCTLANFNPKRIHNHHIIILHGGGNFGDLYPGANEFRNNIVCTFPNNKIIIFPQTITYRDEQQADNDAQIFANHKNLHICARDQQSYDFLQRKFRNHIYLLPDTAVGLFPLLTNKNQRYLERHTLYLVRKDFEIGVNNECFCDKNIVDWDDLLNCWEWRMLLFISRLLKKIIKVGFQNHAKLRVLNDNFLVYVIYPYIYKRIIFQLTKYNEIVSTRLHGVIIAKMLGLQVTWFDTKYGKISSYVNTWMKDV